VKKKPLTILFPVVLAIACAIAVWANEPAATQPPRDKCAKPAKAAPCDDCAKDGMTAAECAKLKTEGKPCGAGYDKGAKPQQEKNL